MRGPADGRAARLSRMARRWQTISVHLLSGRGETLTHPLGRVFILPPRTTFAALGRAIDIAFARWDFSHLREFTLDDGTRIVDDESAAEMRNSMSGPIPKTASLREVVKKRVATTGTQFAYTFDFGDDWFHLCTFEGYADPAEVYGPDDPSEPAPIWGWGTIPDQYGRRWNDDSGADDEDGPPPIDVPPALDRYARYRMTPALVDLGQVRTASAAGDVDALIDAVSGVDLVPALQQVAVAALSVHRSAPAARRDDLFGIIASLHYRAQDRGWDGDDLLSEELLATLQGRAEGSALRAVPVDLDELAVIMTDSIGGGEHEGGYLNTRTGQAIGSVLTDAAYVGADVVVDVEDDPDWVVVAPAGSRDGWQDMADFIETVADLDLRRRLEIAIEGTGAVRRFKDVLHQDADERTRQRWYLEREDRNLGRARALLATHGLRPG